ncbi:MAG: acyltransferase family protein [Thermoleophilia bacterium]|nr:acyltransferase family protein [Thermoleophilia bacterium]
MNAVTTTRRYDIDWLRIIAVLLLFPFHVARIFNVGDEFYAKSDTLSTGLTYLITYLEPWHMPLFFFLAGASTWFALSRRSGGGYAWERLKRLLVPFLFGLVVLIPPQSYLGMLGHGGEPGSFFNWLPTFFHLDPVDPDGYFAGGLTFGHLWFIIHLFLYSIILLPLVLFLRRGAGKRLVDLLARAATKPVVILTFGLLATPAMLVPDLAGGNPIRLAVPFLLGYLVVSDVRFERAVDKHKLVALILGPVACVAVAYYSATDGPGLTGWASEAYGFYAGIMVPWFCIVAFLGYGRRFLNRGGAVQRYAAEASYPVYLLHQTVIVAVGFVTLKTGLGVPLSFTLILAGSFVGTVLAYELVRRVNVLRLMFGLKWRRRSTLAPQAAPSAPAANRLGHGA